MSMSVQSLTSFDPRQFFNPGSRPEVGNYRLDTGVSALSVVREFSGRLDVITADGDRITLVADSDDEYQAGSLHSSVQTHQGTGTLKAGLAQGAHAHNFGVTVSGDLDEDEVTDLEKLFETVSGIFRGFFQGQHEEAKAQTVHLAEGFHGLESLSSLDLSVEIVRSVTIVSASGGTPGGAPAAAAAIPQSSNGTTAPTPSPASSDTAHLSLPANGEQFASLIQQVFEALNELRGDIDKIRRNLPDFLDQLREHLAGELRHKPESKAAAPHHPVGDVSPEHETSSDSRSLLVAYQSVTERSFSLSLQV
ncbi:MAG: hypothetical protein OEV01_10860 [Nitrospira sp.]|nr:hypothetical protein [Nitrospira sp.]MDH5194830.1 hypothetical protein [Nitrospira sp.]